MIRSKKGNLFNYFACDHKDLSKNYLNDCKKFFKTLNKPKEKYGRTTINKRDTRSS